MRELPAVCDLVVLGWCAVPWSARLCYDEGIAIPLFSFFNGYQ
jgi:hypothetical protein